MILLTLKEFWVWMNEWNSTFYFVNHTKKKIQTSSEMFLLAPPNCIFCYYIISQKIRSTLPCYSFNFCPFCNFYYWFKFHIRIHMSVQLYRAIFGKEQGPSHSLS
jgi:hypothetical protein